MSLSCGAKYIGVFENSAIRIPKSAIEVLQYYKTTSHFPLQ